MSTKIGPPPGATLTGLDFQGQPVARERDGRRRILIHDPALGWQLAAMVLESNGRVFTVECPSCPAPRLRKRKATRPLVESVAVHRHGHADSSPVQHRVPHHAGPGYVVIDPLGVLVRTEAPR